MVRSRAGTVNSTWIRDAKRYQRRTGQYFGGNRSLGWRIGEDGALIEDEAEQRALAEVRTLRSAGASYRAISERLRADFGVSIRHQGVKRVLRRQ